VCLLAGLYPDTGGILHQSKRKKYQAQALACTKMSIAAAMIRRKRKAVKMYLFLSYTVEITESGDKQSG
jgi:hypothetical protein